MQVEHGAHALGHQHRQGRSRGLVFFSAEGARRQAVLHAHDEKAQPLAQQRREQALQRLGQAAPRRDPVTEAAALLVAGVFQRRCGSALAVGVLHAAVRQEVRLGIKLRCRVVAVQPGVALGVEAGLYAMPAQAAVPVHEGVVIGRAVPVVDVHARLEPREVERKLVALGEGQDALPPQHAEAAHVGVMVRAQQHGGGGQRCDARQRPARGVEVHLRAHRGHVVVAQAGHSAGFFFWVAPRGMAKGAKEALAR